MRTRRACQLCLILRTLEAQAFRAGKDIKDDTSHLLPHPCLLQHPLLPRLPAQTLLPILWLHTWASCCQEQVSRSAPWVCRAEMSISIAATNPPALLSAA